MKLDRLTVDGYKSFASLRLELGALNVLIGANGAGKSNLISLFRLLNDMVDNRFQLAVGRAGGADVLLHFGSRTTERIEVKLDFGRNAYRCAWVPTAKDRLVFEEEVCSYRGQGHDKPYEVPLGSGHDESRLREAAESSHPSVPWHVLRALESWRVYHFHDTSDDAPVKKTGDLNDNAVLRGDAGNLAAFLYRLWETDRPRYNLVRDLVRRVAPFFDDFVLRPTPENRDKIRLEWREAGSDRPFLASQLSDGTLRFVCLSTLLLQPAPPSTVLVDEPELGLHPFAVEILAGMMRSASARTQLVVATQSVALVNTLEPQEVVVVDRRGRESVVGRPDPRRLETWLEQYSLGELWEKNVIGGRPSPGVRDLLPAEGGEAARG